MTGTTSGSTVGLNLKRPLYLGGIDPAETISQNIGTLDGFVGCIAEVLCISSIASSVLSYSPVFCFYSQVKMYNA